MTNELKRLAQSIFTNPIRNPDNSAFCDAANPATILSLIERVEKAEAHASMLQMAVGEASKTAWTQGRSEALEEAAKVADAHEQSADGKFDGVIKASRNGEKNLELAGAASAGMSHTARRIAAAIRALGEKEK